MTMRTHLPISRVLRGGIATFAAAVSLASFGAVSRAETSVEPFLALSADGRYDDYLPGGSDGFVTRLSPAAGVRFHTERLVLRLQYTGAYNRYEGTTREVPASFNHHGRLEAGYAATRRLRFDISDRFSRALDPREIEQVGIVVPPGIEILDNAAEAKAGYAVTRSMWLSGGYAHRFTRFGDFPTGDGTFVPVPGGQQHDGTLRSTFRLGEHDNLLVGARAQWFFVGDLEAQAYSPTLGFGHRFSPLLGAEVEAGPAFFRQDALGGNGTTWRARAQLLFDTPRWRLLGRFDRDLFGGTGTAGVIWVHAGSGTIRYRALRWLELGTRGVLFQNGLAPLGDTRVEGYDLSAEILFHAGSSVDITTYYLHRRQIDRLAGSFGFDRDVVGLRVTAWITPNQRITEEIR